MKSYWRQHNKKCEIVGFSSEVKLLWVSIGDKEKIPQVFAQTGGCNMALLLTDNVRRRKQWVRLQMFVYQHWTAIFNKISSLKKLPEFPYACFSKTDLFEFSDIWKSVYLGIFAVSECKSKQTGLVYKLWLEVRYHKQRTRLHEGFVLLFVEGGAR